LAVSVDEYRFLYQVLEIPSISYFLEGINQVSCSAVAAKKIVMDMENG